MRKIPKNPNKRDAAEKDRQRAEDGGEHMKAHGTAKTRAIARNRKRAAKKRQQAAPNPSNQ